MRHEDGYEDFTDNGLQGTWSCMINHVLVNQGTRMKPVEMSKSKWQSWSKWEGLMRQSERRNMMQMRKCIVMSPDNAIRVKYFIRNVEVMRNEWMKLVQLGNSEWPDSWFWWNCWWEYIRIMRFDLTICGRVSLLHWVIFFGFQWFGELGFTSSSE